MTLIHDSILAYNVDFISLLYFIRHFMKYVLLNLVKFSISDCWFQEGLQNRYLKKIYIIAFQNLLITVYHIFFLYTSLFSFHIFLSQYFFWFQYVVAPNTYMAVLKYFLFELFYLNIPTTLFILECTCTVD